MLLGYARVSTADQNPDHQFDALYRAGVATDAVYLDRVVVAKASRPHLDALLRALRDGDVLVCTRLARPVLHLVQLGEVLRARGWGCGCSSRASTPPPQGRAMFGMLGVLAEFQRELIVASTRDALIAARARGRRGGRPAALSSPQAAAHAQQLYDAAEHTVAEIAALPGVARTRLRAPAPH